jgi:predicted enzyme related to lactoylglutathione lyase
MSERNDYPAGVPCWIDTLQPDPDAAMRFYGELFGWEFAGPGEMPGDPPGRYHAATLRGKEVAGIGSLPEEPSMPVAWNTHVAVESVEDAAARVAHAGGEVLAGPIEAAPAGRLAAVRDPTGATLGLWEARARQGAQLVNEPSAWSMSALQTTDPERALRFYSEAFGWEPEPFAIEDTPITLWRRPGYIGGEPQQPVPRDVVAAMMPLPDGNAASQWGVDFWIKDATSAADTAAALGGHVLAAPHDIPGFRRTVLADPSGAAFSVSQLQAG